MKKKYKPSELTILKFCSDILSVSNQGYVLDFYDDDWRGGLL